MTDTEIKKALEHNANKCRLYEDSEKLGLYKATLDLLNRQQAEIDGLIAGQETLQKCIADKMVEIEKLKKDIQENNILIDMQDKVLREQTDIINTLKLEGEEK